IGISNAHTTNLAVVAPGIAQALLATAFGLVAAIPAVIIYNVLARQTAHYRAYLGDASAQVMRLVSRDLDRAKLPMTEAAEGGGRVPSRRDGEQAEACALRPNDVAGFLEGGGSKPAPADPAAEPRHLSSVLTSKDCNPTALR